MKIEKRKGCRYVFMIFFDFKFSPKLQHQKPNVNINIDVDINIKTSPNINNKFVSSLAGVMLFKFKNNQNELKSE